MDVDSPGKTLLPSSSVAYPNILSCSMKPGRVVILLAGRHAGKKAIIVKQNDDGKKVSTPRSLTNHADAPIGQKVRSRLGSRY